MESRFDVRRRHAQQRAKSIPRPATTGLQSRNQGFGATQDRQSLFHVQLAHRALLEPILRNTKRVLLQLHILASQLQPFVQGPELNVVRRHFGLKNHQDIVVVFDFGAEVRVGRLDGAAETSPEIEFPGGVEADRPVVELELGQRKLPERIGVLAQPIARVSPDGLLALRKEVSASHVQLGSRFDHPHAGKLQRQILLVGRVDQVVENRILERRPPVGVVGGHRFHVVVLGVEPRIGDGGGRLAIVGTHLKAVECPLFWPCHATRGCEHNRQ